MIVRVARKRLMFLRKAWDESSHTRDEHGRFGSSTGAELHASLNWARADHGPGKPGPRTYGVRSENDYWGKHVGQLTRAGLLTSDRNPTVSQLGHTMADMPPAEFATAFRALPGATPDNPIRGDTHGAPDGAYVDRVRRERPPPVATPPVRLDMVDTPADLRPIFGDKMPDLASFARMWGHPASSTEVRLNAPTLGGHTKDIDSFDFDHEPEPTLGKKCEISGNVYRNGQRVGEISRTFTRNPDGTLTVEHGLFTVHAKTAGSGAASAMLAQSIQAYKTMGVDRVTTHPAWSGPYVWASLGYDDPMGASVGKVSGVDRCRSALASYLQNVHGIPRDRAAEIANSLNHLHQFADLDLTKDGDHAGPGRPGMTMHHVSAQTDTDGNHVAVDIPVGAHFLLTTSNWAQAAIDLKDKSSASYQRAHARLGIAP